MKPVSVLVDGSTMPTKWPSADKLADIILDATQLSHLKKVFELPIPEKRNMICVSALDTHLTLHWSLESKKVLFSLDVFSYDPNFEVKTLASLIIRGLGDVDVDGIRRYQRW